MKYDIPVKSGSHARFCAAFAVKRYGKNLIRDSYGMLLVEDEDGTLHTDAVLRALSFYNEPSLPK